MTNVREVNLVFKMLVIFLNIKILARYTAKSVISLKYNKSFTVYYCKK